MIVQKGGAWREDGRGRAAGTLRLDSRNRNGLHNKHLQAYFAHVEGTKKILGYCRPMIMKNPSPMLSIPTTQGCQWSDATLYCLSSTIDLLI